MKLLVAATLVAAPFMSVAAKADVVNFDEYTSPPVDCCFFSSGITGPLAYPNVTVVDGAGGGYVMNSGGWDNRQTSGDNLFGTLSGSIYFNFGSAASNVMFDLINGTDAFTFTVNALDASGAVLGSASPSLLDFATDGSVGHVSFGFGGIKSVQILGNDDFAVDTLSFDVSGAVPEPASWAMMLLGFGLLGGAMRRRATVVSFA